MKKNFRLGAYTAKEVTQRRKFKVQNSSSMPNSKMLMLLRLGSLTRCPSSMMLTQMNLTEILRGHQNRSPPWDHSLFFDLLLLIYLQVSILLFFSIFSWFCFDLKPRGRGEHIGSSRVSKLMFCEDRFCTSVLRDWVPIKARRKELVQSWRKCTYNRNHGCLHVDG